jgi:hypothetical protein
MPRHALDAMWDPPVAVPAPARRSSKPRAAPPAAKPPPSARPSVTIAVLIDGWLVTVAGRRVQVNRVNARQLAALTT